MSARNVMRSDIYCVLREKARLVIVSPLAKDPIFREEFEHPNVTFFELPRQSKFLLRVTSALLFPIETTLFTSRHDVSTLRTLRDQLRWENPFRYFIYRTMTGMLGYLPGFVGGLRQLYYLASRNPAAEELISRSSVDLVFITHGYVQEEIELALAAKKLGISVINMIHSWDNVTSKSAMRQMVSPNVGRLWPADLISEVVVWNEILAEELVELYGFPRKMIFVAGIPQFDAYADRKGVQPRDEFFKSIGGDPAKALILYMAASPSLFHDQTVVVRDLAEAIRLNRFGRPAQLLVRFHPRTDMSDWAQKFKGTGVLFHRPSAAFAALPVEKGWTRGEENANEIVNQIFHSDLILNGFSTTSLDAAAFDKPVICYGYDGDAANLPMIEKLYKGVTHYEKLMALEGIRVAKNADELIQAVDLYLKDPGLDAEGRARIRDKECSLVDGQSGRRIAEFLLSRLP